MMRGNRPSIFRIGQVHDDGATVTVTGWGVGLCMTGCICHQDPQTRELRIDDDTPAGTLGLLSHRPGCTCCSPWTVAELTGVLNDLADIEALSHSS